MGLEGQKVLEEVKEGAKSHCWESRRAQSFEYWLWREADRPGCAITSCVILSRLSNLSKLYFPLT